MSEKSDTSGENPRYNRPRDKNKPLYGGTGFHAGAVPRDRIRGKNKP